MNQSSKSYGACERFLIDHQNLIQEITELRQWCHEVDEIGCGPKFEEFGMRLKSFRDHLATHMADEEREGYLAPALEVAPRFSEHSHELKQQHQQFLDQLDALVLRLQSDRFERWDDARGEFEEFLSNVRQHEAAENSIVQSAFGNDLGTAD